MAPKWTLQDRKHILAAQEKPRFRISVTIANVNIAIESIKSQSSSSKQSILVLLFLISSRMTSSGCPRKSQSWKPCDDMMTLHAQDGLQNYVSKLFQNERVKSIALLSVDFMILSDLVAQWYRVKGDGGWCFLCLSCVGQSFLSHFSAPGELANNCLKDRIYF